MRLPTIHFWRRGSPRLTVHLIAAVSLAGLFSAIAPFSAAEEVLYEQKLEPYPVPILVPASIGGNHYTFLLDTGATSHSIDPTLRYLLGPWKETRSVSAPGGNMDIEFYGPPKITLGGWTLPDSEAGLFDFDGFRSVSGFDIQGLIGWSALSRCALSLDFDHQSLKILHGVSSPGTMESMELAFDDGQLPRIKVDIHGYSVKLIIDTGNNSYVGLEHSLFVKMVIEGKILVNKHPGVTETASGTTAEVSGHFASGVLLGMNLEGIPVSDEGSWNVIGLGFLLNFNVVIDLANSRFLYQQRRAPPPIDMATMLGAGFLYPGRRNYVYRLSPEGGAARNAGIKEGDHILRLGPLKEADLNITSIYELCLNHAGETMEVEYLRGGGENPIVTHLQLPEKIFVYPPRKSK